MATSSTPIPRMPAAASRLMNTYNYLDLVPKGRDEDSLRVLDGMGSPPRSLRGWPPS